jgi:hypothetical protein
MTNEQVQLLVKDLCGRLPYGVKVQPSGSASPHKFIGYDKGLARIDTDQRYELENIKPYLRPMESMTDDEYEYYWGDNNFINLCDRVDWLNKYMFDYRGLIGLGLALPAPDEMYND